MLLKRWLKRSLTSNKTLDPKEELTTKKSEYPDKPLQPQEENKKLKSSRRGSILKKETFKDVTLQEQKTPRKEKKKSKKKKSSKKERTSKKVDKKEKPTHEVVNSNEAEQEVQEEEEIYDESSTDEINNEDAEGGNDDFMGDYNFEEKDASAEEENDFSCLSPEEIIKEQRRMITEVAELLNVPEASAANMLRHYKWKKEILFGKYFDNPQAVLVEAGCDSSVLKKKKKHKSKNQPELSSSRIKLTGVGGCLICGEDKEANDCSAMSCKHRFCNECYTSFLTFKINEREVTKLTCPAVGCNLVVPEEMIKQLVPEETFKKYYSFITQSFVEDNREVTWCPAPNCGHAITTDMVSRRVVTCKCGFSFCFTCHNEAHAPASCAQVKEWIRKCQDDSETVNWIGANTKDCPNCSVAVEKNGGCNHMVCRMCSHEWCWLCIKPWKGHNDYYTCNRYIKTQKKIEKKKKKKGKKAKLEKEEEERQKHQKQLERYLHYFERYVNHDNASKMEKQIREKAYKKIQELTSGESTFAEVKFIERGTNVLLQCQNVLKYSYVFAYFLSEDGPEKPLFNWLQKELETTTEQLGGILESNGTIHRVDAVNLTKLAETKKNNLLRAVEQGLVENV
eukprot:TRINITY_DN1185_c0_g1_i2.p1 TRINITY_DN1185_c0_g1~~TRINITY_DN1185_c0_g1_i2.p1  ORF type:complete len:622 (+),score=122.87 TRINITY_DN1185_c0_g1_i2:56-1921(+)